MRPTPLALILSLVACAGPPGATQPEAAPAIEESAEPVSPERSAELEALLPLSPERVCWYRLEPGPGAPRRVAFYLRQDAPGVRWQALGLERLSLWRTPQAIWLLGVVLPRLGAVRVWAPDAGEEGDPVTEQVETAAGRFTCVRAEVAAGEGTAVAWLARGTGLIALELRRDGETTRLELVEACPRGPPPGGYRRGSPDELWASVEEALLRLDADGIDQLIDERLRARARRPRTDGGGPRRRAESGDAAADRIEGELLEWVLLAPTRKGPWEVTGDQASAPGELSRPGARVPCRLLLRRGEGGWSWDGLEVAED